MIASRHGHCPSMRIGALSSHSPRPAARLVTAAAPEQQLERAPALGPLLQTVELAAITVAAGSQAVLLLQPAFRAAQVQHSPPPPPEASTTAPEPIAATALLAGTTGDSPAAPQPAVALVAELPAHSAAEAAATVAPAQPAHGGFLYTLSTSAMLVALMCNMAIRSLVAVARPGAPHKLSAEGAARLVHLEATSRQHASEMATGAKQLAKLSARVQVATADLKQPLRQLQEAAGQQAAALAALAEQQGGLGKRLEGLEEVLGALQEVQAKQFRVTAQVLQQAQQRGAASSSRAPEVAALRQQQQKLQAAVKAQQQHLLKLEVLLQQAKQSTAGDSSDNGSTTSSSSHSSSVQAAGTAGSNGASSTMDGTTTSSSSNSSGGGAVVKGDGVPPDPWQLPTPPSPAMNVPHAGPAIRRR